ncbi:MAG: hypothetical protein IKO07_11665 [Clostridia bacterium]|nr:hypothetical protein [Clostridia bacterium]
MKKMIRPLGALALLALVCSDPAGSAAAAREALNQWAGQVVPSLLPFLVALPALTCEEAKALFGRAAGGVMRLVGCPALLAPAWFTALLSGSPAGAAALAACAGGAGSGALLRCAVLASGASPAFLLGALGAGMLGSAQAGWQLIGAQALAALSTALLMRRLPDAPRAAVAAPPPPPREAAMPGAMRALMMIGGYMALFAVIAARLGALLGEAWTSPLQMALELGGGCRAAAGLPLLWPEKLALTAAVASLGGASVTAQSLTFLRPLGVKAGAYVFWKLVESGLCALWALLMAAYLPALDLRAAPADLPAALLCVAVMALGAAAAKRRVSAWRGA